MLFSAAIISVPLFYYGQFHTVFFFKENITEKILIL